MEAWDTNTSVDYYRTVVTNSWKEQAHVTGGIKNLHKTFGYVSEMRV